MRWGRCRSRSPFHRVEPLKLYVAANAGALGFSESALATVEHSFLTGDRVDVLVENHWPERTVVEVEVEGEANVCVGLHQAVKYRSLAEIEAGFPLLTPKVHGLVVAYDTHYSRAEELAARYDVSLLSIDRDAVLASAV
jgi:hypothetical protein